MARITATRDKQGPMFNPGYVTNAKREAIARIARDQQISSACAESVIMWKLTDGESHPVTDTTMAPPAKPSKPKRR